MTKYSLRQTREDEKQQLAYSHSIVEAILTCPRWGITRYIQGLYYPTTNRAMPLEAGSAMHEVFAAVRLWQLLRIQQLPDHFQHHGERLFNTDEQPDRFNQVWSSISDTSDLKDELTEFAFKMLNSGEFYDDPDDNMRTMANMEYTTIKYIEKLMPLMEKNPIWVADLHKPTAPVGIEIVFDMMVEELGDDQWQHPDGKPPFMTNTIKRKVRYIGTLDGLIQRTDNHVRLDENKTASRLDETWRKAFDVKTQPTGYIAAASMFTEQQCEQARIIGIKVKQTKSVEDFLMFTIERDVSQIASWARDLFFCDELTLRYKDDVLQAPQFTHSCSRYFRPCAFIDWCAAGPEDQVAIYEGMVPSELSPSQRTAGITR